ncbi:MAG: response regulator [Methanoregula sp.]|nr:response regulator [Methanoregula sp.]
MHSVLFIDDEPALLEGIKILSGQVREISVETAQSAKEGLKILEGKTFDAIIVDYSLSGITGIDFLKTLRSKGDYTPVIIFTAIERGDAAIEVLNNGANYFLKKSVDPRIQYPELVTAVRQVVEQSSIGRSTGTIRQILSEMIHFSSDPSFAIDRYGGVVAWNDSMEQLTNVPANVMVGKGDFAYAEPFFGIRKKMLVDLVFASDEEIRQAKYMQISRVPKGTIIAVTRGQKKDGCGWTLWAKAQPIYDSQGDFIAVVSVVRDVTATFGDIPLREQSAEGHLPAIPTTNAATSPEPVKGLIKKMLGRALIHYKEGVGLYLREKDYTGAIASFDLALSIDEKLSYAWNDRGICYRELGDNTNALKSLLRAVELVPDNPEYLFNLGETLELIGVLNNNNKYVDSAIQTFNMVADLLPNNTAVWEHLGKCHTIVGKSDESRFFFDRAREIRLGRKDTPINLRCIDFL